MYIIKVRRPGQWFYRSLKVLEHNYVGQQDKTVCLMVDGSIYELPEVSKCEVKMSKSTIETLHAMKKATANDNVPNPQEPNHK